MPAVCPTCWSTAPTASPSAWPPRSRPTTWARSATACWRCSTTRIIEPHELLEHVQGPDFPTGGIIYGRRGIYDYVTTGRGRVVVRARTDIEIEDGGRAKIIVTEIPYQVNKAHADREDRRPGARRAPSRASATCATSPTATACASSSC